MIYKYEILNCKIDKKRPFFDKNGLLYIPHIGKHYKYYIAATRYNTTIAEKEYFLLLSNTKFDFNCRNCNVDDWGRLKINLKGEIKDYLIDKYSNYSNVNVEYIESEDDYDVYLIS